MRRCTPLRVGYADYLRQTMSTKISRTTISDVAWLGSSGGELVDADNCIGDLPLCKLRQSGFDE